MQELCERQGVVFHFDTPVRKLVHSADRVSHILTDKGKLACDVIVIAAGSHSVALLRPLGLSLPVRPAKGYSLTMPLDDLAQAPRLPVIDDLLHAAVTPLHGRLRVAGTAEFAGFDVSITRTRVDNLLRLLRGIYPQIAARARPDSIVPWIGFRPMCADGVPVLGPTPVNNLFLSTGHGHLGWTMAAGSGKAVADLIAGGSAKFSVAPYELARFG
jgi:D-amino-acid dehydrogenase